MNKFTILKQRYKILLNYVIGPLLFIVLCWGIYRKIQTQPNLHSFLSTLQSAVTGEHSLLFWLVLALSLVNWGIEARKWQLLIKGIQRVGLWQAFKAVLSGLAFSLFIPNRAGEYVGRILYMSEGNRLRSVSLTIVGSISQLLVTLTAGLGGLIYLRVYLLPVNDNLRQLPSFWLDGLLYVTAFGVLILLLIYYKLAWLTTLFEKIPFVYKYRFLIEQLENFHWRELTRILVLSIGRFVVFIVQYLLLLSVFAVTMPVTTGVWLVCVLFLVLAIVPTIPIAELGVRGAVGIQLFGLISSNTTGILLTAAGIWCINIIVPALAGSLFILSIKLFKK
ncbi:lysylphosphatidylglycerol synthase domain-containing protein [Deminuibacter soli]|uniref:lysylphosphatidylglycerol synthase domain-containing protein n=1 Tax=Deminuibacter soli TaxID=2291815 RepID=UPI001314E945|nr:lysylphosphatidylglycerol synthase domain-containing protein [Deminuibacter soli]